ncbi:MAG TPA: hypothetical protein VF992_12185 [Thermoplasmata archaeon]
MGSNLQSSLADSVPSLGSNDFAKRALDTLALMHQWGYAPSVDTLAAELLGGSVDPSQVLTLARESTAMSIMDGFVYLHGNQRLVAKSRSRVASHHLQNGEALSVAKEFAHDLIRACPVVDCVALSGSAASGGYTNGDDVDFDLFTRDGTKYLVYGVALAIGLKAALLRWRSRGFRKLICINVIWSHSEATPFARQDQGLAFELLHCNPLVGDEFFAKMLTKNEWIFQHFPQLSQKLFAGNDRPEPSLVGRFILRVSVHPRFLSIVDRLSRAATRCAYEFAHRLKSRNKDAVERLEFLQRVKYPYEVFQD